MEPIPLLASERTFVSSFTISMFLLHKLTSSAWPEVDLSHSFPVPLRFFISLMVYSKAMVIKQLLVSDRSEKKCIRQMFAYTDSIIGAI
jgi:hypothetical protein